MARLLIRRMVPAELEAVVGIWERSRRDAMPLLEARTRHKHEDDLRYFRDVVAVVNEVWVAEEEGRLLGLLAVGKSCVDRLYVEPDAQGRGVGTALLDKAKTLVPKGLTLYTHIRNQTARDFYERRGFRAVAFGVSPAPENEPDVKYAWEPGEVGG